MPSLWKHYDPENARYEHGTPTAFPWNRTRQDVPRYVLGDDGYWFNPAAVEADTALLSCTGDLMCEPRMTNAHRYGDTYFFHPLFRYVRDIFHASDFCVGNLETAVTDTAAYAGDYHVIAGQYHCNAPISYLDAVRYAGFDALVTANNHTCDAGITGIRDTLRNLDERGFMRTGTFLPSDTERVLFVKINGIRVAFLSYASYYNHWDEKILTDEGIHTFLNYYSEETARRDVAYARERGAEFIIGYIHWGKDYDREPGEKQLAILKTIKNTGMDYIIGSHTHCLQAFTHVTNDDTGETVPLMFSMGNFVTNERKELCKHTGILQLLLRRDGERITATEYFIPCYVFDEFGTGRFCVVPADGQLNGGYAHERMDGIRAYVRERIGDLLPELPSGAHTLSELCAAMNVPLPEEIADRPVTHLSLQSGALRHGSLYFVMDEPTRVDTRRAAAANITAAVTTEPIDGLPYLLVSDVKAAFLAANAVIRPHGNTTHTIVVAGAHGKTVTRELLARALRPAGGVLTVRDNEHMDISPWQDVHPHHAYTVLELRDDHPLGVRDAAASLCPDTVVATAAPCDLAALADALPVGGTLFVNGTDKTLCDAAAALTRTDITVQTYTTSVPCDGLPFDDLAVCTAAAYAVATALGVSDPAARAAIAPYTVSGYTETVCEVDGVSLILRTNAKYDTALISALRAPANGRRIAVLGALDSGTYTPAFTEALAAWQPAAVLTLGDCGLTNATVCEDTTALETALLAILRDGDTVLIGGGRACNIREITRRVFGLTDGFLFGAS